MGIGDKVKDVAHKVGIGGHKGEEERGSEIGSSYQNVGGTYGAEGATGGYAEGGETRTAEVPVVQQTTSVPVALVPTEAQAGERSQPQAPRESGEVGQKGGEAVCSSEYFTKVEDRPVVKERVELVQEHRPVEKEFVVETRATGVEREVRGGQVETLGTTERIVGVTPPKAPCE